MSGVGGQKRKNRINKTKSQKKNEKKINQNE